MQWHEVGETTLGRLPQTADVGLFVTSPVALGGSATRATARFDHVTLDGKTAQFTADNWLTLTTQLIYLDPEHPNGSIDRHVRRDQGGRCPSGNLCHRSHHAP